MSSYLKSIGREQGQIEKDEEGLQNARVVARNMVFLMKAIKDAKEKYGLPEKEDTTYTHFLNKDIKFNSL